MVRWLLLLAIGGCATQQVTLCPVEVVIKPEGHIVLGLLPYEKLPLEEQEAAKRFGFGPGHLLAAAFLESDSSLRLNREQLGKGLSPGAGVQLATRQVSWCGARENQCPHYGTPASMSTGDTPSADVPAASGNSNDARPTEVTLTADTAGEKSSAMTREQATARFAKMGASVFESQLALSGQTYTLLFAKFPDGMKTIAFDQDGRQVLLNKNQDTRTIKPIGEGKSEIRVGGAIIDVSVMPDNEGRLHMYAGEQPGRIDLQGWK
jgi:hypothetical protein